MNICESDIAIMSRKNKSPVLVISRFIILTSNRSFDDIYNFLNANNTRTYEYRGYQRKSIIQWRALFRRFDKTLDYMHGFIIYLTGNYTVEGRVV